MKLFILITHIFFHAMPMQRLVLVFAFIGVLAACAPPGKTETVLYEEAEVHYRAGDYQRALDGYESFLKLYPESPLADVARIRIRSINREVSAVLGRSDIPKPKWIPPAAAKSSEPETNAGAEKDRSR